MSRWNHPICFACWWQRHGERVPVRILEPPTERCCWCGRPTGHGIYVRWDPAEIPDHVDHE